MYLSMQEGWSTYRYYHGLPLLFLSRVRTFFCRHVPVVANNRSSHLLASSIRNQTSAAFLRCRKRSWYFSSGWTAARQSLEAKTGIYARRKEANLSTTGIHKSREPEPCVRACVRAWIYLYAGSPVPHVQGMRFYVIGTLTHTSTHRQTDRRSYIPTCPYSGLAQGAKRAYTVHDKRGGTIARLAFAREPRLRGTPVASPTQYVRHQD